VTPTVRLLSAREVVGAYHVDLARVYLLAHRKKWRRIKYGGRVYYDLADVDRTLGRA